MEKEEIISIAVKVSEGTATSEEMAMYIYHIDSFIKEYPEWEDLNVETKQVIEAQLRSDIYAQVNDGQLKIKSYKLWLRIISIAAAISFIFLGIYFINYRNDKYPGIDNSVVQDVKPGKNRATLTLASGKKILLSDAMKGQIANEAGVRISKTEDGQVVYEVVGLKAEVAGKYNTMTTARGEQWRLDLPDGTRVWLNSASSLRYPAFFPKTGSRKVELTGEAYFEVAKDKQHQFIVNTKDQNVEVLGTHFNINAYPDERSVKTTLFEGSVKVNPRALAGALPDGERATVLKPGEQSVLANNGIKVSIANMEQALAWKNGYFLFENEDIKSIMREISRWYDVDVIYLGNVEQKTIEGTVSKFKNVSTVLDMLESTKVVKFKIDGKQIIVTPGKDNN
jgi:transmembrane sensor